MNSHDVFIFIHHGCFVGTGAIVRLPQCQWSKPDGYGKISQYITTTKHSKAKTACIFLGIYCTLLVLYKSNHTYIPMSYMLLQSGTLNVIERQSLLTERSPNVIFGTSTRQAMSICVLNALRNIIAKYMYVFSHREKIFGTSHPNFTFQAPLNDDNGCNNVKSANVVPLVCESDLYA